MDEIMMDKMESSGSEWGISGPSDNGGFHWVNAILSVDNRAEWSIFRNLYTPQIEDIGRA